MKLAALEGIHTWAGGVIDQAARMNAYIERLHREIGSKNGLDERWHEHGREFQRARVDFLSAAHRMMEHIEWAKRLDYLDEAAFADVGHFREEVKAMRDMNEHALDYVFGKGRRSDFMHEQDGGTCSATGTVDTMLGGRLDWTVLAAAVEEMRARLPAMYDSKAPLPGQPGSVG